MSLSIAPTNEPPPDRRQSPTALALARGVRRLFYAAGFSSLPELTLPNGRRADVAALSRKGEVHVVEIKSSVADFRSDQKWGEYLGYCDNFFFAVPLDFPRELLPADAGLIVADAFRAEILRPSPRLAISASARRALLLRYALTAADRLHALADPLRGHPDG